jgi:hypothetical protein
MAEELCKNCVGNVHVNLANDKHSYISLDELAFFNVITSAVYMYYATLLSEAVMSIINEKYSF